MIIISYFVAEICHHTKVTQIFFVTTLVKQGPGVVYDGEKWKRHMCLCDMTEIMFNPFPNNKFWTLQTERVCR